MSRNRTSKFEAPGSFKCDCCGYETGKSANYHRHLASDRHLRVLNFSNQINCEINENDLCTDSASTQPIDMIVDGATVDCQTSYGTDNYDQDFEEEEEEDEAVEDNDEQEYYEEQSHDARIDTEWFPFDSKIHFLLTSLYSSKTHRVHEDKDGNISWMIKPTSMLKLQLANPVLSNQIFRSGIEAFDGYLTKRVILTTDISLIVTDYQMMSLACNHLGPSANKYCPKCNVSIHSTEDKSHLPPRLDIGGINILDNPISPIMSIISDIKSGSILCFLGGGLRSILEGVRREL
ncbi:unnamed protein product [Mytilus edulis]|uniref:Uncharacterized protein n=1 Tax=Mytilus edulis TaxID=6550 RepID=A0A8S3QGD2_MYTED|nr:unnamed protein product [Mytilus edulis]